MVRTKHIHSKQKFEETIQKKIFQSKREKIRKKPVNHVLDEIRHYQKVTENMILKKPFQRLIKEILINVQMDNYQPLYRMSCAAMCALQEAAESYLTDLMTDGVFCALHANRITLFPRDFDLVLRLSAKY